MAVYLKRVVNIKYLVVAAFFCSFVSSCQHSGNHFEIEKISPLPTLPKQNEKEGLISFDSYSVFVSSGNETVEEIANKLGIDYNYLSKYNGMSYFFKPEKGTILALPIGYELKTLNQTSFNVAETKKVIEETNKNVTKNDPIENNLIHVVKKNETIFTIARFYKISVKSIIKRNDLSSDFQLYDGQKLKIPLPRSPDKANQTQLSALVDFKDTTVFNSPLRPDINVKSTTTVNDDISKDPILKLNLFRPMSGEVINGFNISSTGVRNEGIDIKGSEGASVYSIHNGTVVLVSTSAGKRLNVVIIKHDEEFLSIYAGLQRVEYQKGQKVEKGWKIGTVNEVNNTLHFELRRGNTPLDPEAYLK